MTNQDGKTIAALLWYDRIRRTDNKRAVVSGGEADAGKPMGWEDRQYYRDRGDVRSPLGFLLYGSVPLFTAFGIRVRAHSS